MKLACSLAPGDGSLDGWRSDENLPASKLGKKIVRQTVDSYLQGLKFNDVESFKRASLEAYEDSTYTDYISLLKLADGWKIVNKVFVRGKTRCVVGH